jgi:hypothetical protein
VSGQPHVVHVRLRNSGVGHDDRIVPEAEPVDAGRALGDGEKRFAVRAFHPCHQDDIAAPLHGAGIEHGIDGETLHHERVGGLIEVVAPEKRGVGRGEDRIAEALEPAVRFLKRFIAALEQAFMRRDQMRPPK